MSIENEEIDVIQDDNDREKDSIVFSVTYQNYADNIQSDRKDKVLGQWSIIPEREEHLKYAYVYLKDSDKMIVKKYEIESIFPTTDDERWDITKGRKCFSFKSSENVFFEYPGVPVQARQYGYSSKLDAEKKLSDAEVERRFTLSREGRPSTTKSSTSTKRKKPFTTAKEMLIEVITEHYNATHKAPLMTDVSSLVEKVKEVDLNNRVEAIEQGKLVMEEYYSMKPNLKR